jgi:hypothetical protein
MSQIVSQRRIHRWVLDVSDLPMLPPGSIIPEKALEVYKLPARRRVHDAFYYTVLLDKDKHLFWIVRSGGFAGGANTFGPGKGTR